MTSSSSPLPANLQSMFQPPAATTAPSAERLGDRIMNTAHLMQEMVLTNPKALVSSGNRFKPDIDPMSKGLPFKQALADFEPLALPPDPTLPVALAVALTVQAKLESVMVQTVLNLSQGMPFSVVEENWKLKLEQFKGQTADEHNAKIDANPGDAALVASRDAALAALDKLGETGPGSTFHKGLVGLDRIMTSQKNLNRDAILEKTASKVQGRTFTQVLDLGKTQAELEKDVNQTKDAILNPDIDENDVKAGVKGPAEMRTSGIYKVTGEHGDNKKPGVQLTFGKDKDGNDEVTGRPFPRSTDDSYYPGADFKERWSKTLDALAQEGTTIELSGGKPKSLLAMMDIMFEQHKDRYIELAPDALEALHSLGTAEVFEKIAQMKAHNAHLLKTNDELLQHTVLEIQARVVDQGLTDIQALKTNVNDGMVARIDSLMMDLDKTELLASPARETREMVIIERLIAEIEKQTKELGGRNDSELVDREMKTDERVTAINGARGKVEQFLDGTRATQLPPAPPVTNPPTPPTPLTPDQTELDTKLKALSDKCKDVKTKVEAVAEKKVEAVNNLSNSGPASP